VKPTCRANPTAINRAWIPSTEPAARTQHGRAGWRLKVGRRQGRKRGAGPCGKRPRSSRMGRNWSAGEMLSPEAADRSGTRTRLRLQQIRASTDPITVQLQRDSDLATRPMAPWTETGDNGLRCPSREGGVAHRHRGTQSAPEPRATSMGSGVSATLGRGSSDVAAGTNYDRHQRGSITSSTTARSISVAAIRARAGGERNPGQRLDPLVGVGEFLVPTQPHLGNRIDRRAACRERECCASRVHCRSGSRPLRHRCRRHPSIRLVPCSIRSRPEKAKARLHLASTSSKSCELARAMADRSGA